MSDGFFDVPAGMRDADLEMAELTERAGDIARWRRQAEKWQLALPADPDWDKVQDALASIRQSIRETRLAAIAPFNADTEGTLGWHR